ncbi:MAG: 1,4-alpha-glucan branching protein GlgB [Puniceicoccaceae bacterium]|nr:MAG: 1,4-alpha-glucan branching protein GlgB [Puniceicoccaceae bacterium]
MLISKAELTAFREARVARPHDLLGLHPLEGKNKLVARAYIPGARSCEVVEVDAPRRKTHPLKKLSEDGFYEGIIAGRSETFTYRLRIETNTREVRQFFDPYAFPPGLGPQDLYLFNEGTEYRIYEKLGAHPRTRDGVPGVAFAVWAPNARRVSVVGNFNQWDGRYHPMRALESSGVWELFIPGLTEGDLYKYEILGADGNLHLKTDPYGTYFEAPPNNASIVCDVRKHQWQDGEWMARRAEGGQADQPMSVYEVHLGSWRRLLEDNQRPLNYRELAHALGDYVTEMGFTHVELMPVAEHPFEGSWGYQVTGFFAPTHRFGRPADFQYFVDHLHQRGVGVILDWVPAHFPRDSFALSYFDGTHLYEHEDPRLGAHQDWGTLIFNYGRHEVRCFLIANALSWLDRYHIDGLRVDAVASMLYLDYSRKEGEWIPNRYGGRENLEAIDFLRTVNDRVHEYYPGTIMAAEESTSWPGVTKPTFLGGLGFDLKWNMGWMHDTLRYFSKDPIHRRWHQNDLTFGMLYQYAERFITVFSHDEVTHGKGSMLMKMGSWSIHDKACNLRALYAHMWAWPGKKLLFMGGEFGQSAEWNYAASLDWHLCQYLDHEGIRLVLKDLNRLYREQPAFHAGDFEPKGFQWVSCWDAEGSIVAYLRQHEEREDFFLVVGHFTPVVRTGYRIGVPRGGFWKEAINTDSALYGGGNTGNHGGLMADAIPADGLPFSLSLSLPPLSTSILEWVG